MKTIITIAALILSVSTYAQITEKVYYDLAKTKIKFSFQTNANHIKNGAYKAFSKTGSVIEEGSYKMGKKTGTWKQYDDYGKPYSIMNYVDDKIHGVYKQWCFEDGKTVSYLCGDYIYNMGKEEKAIQYWPNGNKSKNVVKDGVCNEWFENGNKKSEWTNKDGVSSAMTYFLENGKPEYEVKNGKTYKYSSYHSEYGFDNYGLLESIRYYDSGYKITCVFNMGNAENQLFEIKQEYTDSTYNARQAQYAPQRDYVKLYENMLVWRFDNGKLNTIRTTYNGNSFENAQFSTKEEFENDPRAIRGNKLYEENSKK